MTRRTKKTLWVVSWVVEAATAVSFVAHAVLRPDSGWVPFLVGYLAFTAAMRRLIAEDAIRKGKK